MKPSDQPAAVSDRLPIRGDVSKCPGHNAAGLCDLTESCGRYLRPSHPTYQRWIDPIALGDDCLYFEPANPETST